MSALDGRKEKKKDSKLSIIQCFCHRLLQWSLKSVTVSCQWTPHSPLPATHEQYCHKQLPSAHWQQSPRGDCCARVSVPRLPMLRCCAWFVHFLLWFLVDQLCVLDNALFIIILTNAKFLLLFLIDAIINTTTTTTTCTITHVLVTLCWLISSLQGYRFSVHCVR